MPTPTSSLRGQPLSPLFSTLARLWGLIHLDCVAVFVRWGGLGCDAQCFLVNISLLPVLLLSYSLAFDYPHTTFYTIHFPSPHYRLMPLPAPSHPSRPSVLLYASRSPSLARFGCLQSVWTHGGGDGFGIDERCRLESFGKCARALVWLLATA
jgi:hypothetical protein